MADDGKAKIVLSAEDKTKAAFDSAKKNLKELGDKAEGIGSHFGTIGAAVTAAFAGASLKGVIDAGDELNKLSQKTGIAVESLSVLQYAGDLANVGIEDLATGVKHLGNSMADAAGGSKDAQAIFSSLGVSFKTASGSLRSTDQVLGDIADKFASYEDGAGKAALATSLFGKNGTVLIPFLNQGREGLEQMRAEATRFGVVIGPEFAQQAEQFNDNLTKINKTFEAQKLLVAEEIVPTLNLLAEAFLATKENGEKVSLVGEAIRITLETLAVVGATVVDVLKGTGREIGAWAAQINALLHLDFEGFKAISKAVEDDAKRAEQELKDFNDRVLKKGKFGTTGAPAFEEGFIGSGALSGKKKAPTPDKNAKDTAAAYDSLIKKIQERGAAEAQLLAGGRELTEGEKFGLQVVTELGQAHNKLTAEQKRNAAAQLEQVLQLANANDERKRQAEADRLTAEAAQQHIQDLLKEADARRDSNKSLGEQIEEIGLSADALDALRIKRLEAAKAQEEENLVKARGAEASAAELVAMQQNIDLLDRQINLRKAGKTAQDREANDPRRGFQRAIDDYQKQAEQAGLAVEDLTKRTVGGLEDELTNLFSGQKSNFKRLVDDALAELIRLQIVRPMLNNIFKGIGGAAGDGGPDLTSLFELGSVQFFAGGGNLGAGKWGIAGEAGPEWVKGPAQIVPMGGGMGGGYTDNRTLYIDGTADIAKTTQQTAGMLAEYDRGLWQRLRAAGVTR